MTPMRNAFESLCELAGRNRWCWKLVCTTCGHMCFRCSFQELVRGKHPDSSDWQIYGPRDPRQPFPEWRDWPIEEQRVLSTILSQARLTTIASHARFPDWLGYLGLGLHYTVNVERKGYLLTRNWGPQLLDVLPQHSPMRARLAGTWNPPDGILTWQQLESIEFDLMRWSPNLRD